MGHLIAHGFWRSCSTYVWGKARSATRCIAYYEPLNACLSGPVRSLEVNSLSWNSRHPDVANYFNEIISAYQCLGISEYPQRAGEWESESYFTFSDDISCHLKTLVQAFIQGSADSCFWGFVRGAPKIAAIHALVSRYSDAKVVSLLINRDPVQQLASFLYQSSTGNYFFESRLYAMWLRGRLASGLLDDSLRASCGRADQFDLHFDSALQSMPRRIELTTYLYACMICKSLLLALQGWDAEKQAEFVLNNCFLVDNFSDDHFERMRLVARMAEAGISISLDDFRLERQKSSVSVELMCDALSCAIKHLLRELPAECSLVLIRDYLDRLTAIDSFYAKVIPSCSIGQPFSERERLFMEDVKSQAEDFVLLADNKRMQAKIAHSNDLIQDQAARIALLEEELSSLKENLGMVKSSRAHDLRAIADRLEKVKALTNLDR